MAESNRSDREHRTSRLTDDPVLADFAAPFPDVLGDDRENLTRGFERIAERLGRSKRSALVRFTLGEGEETRAWSLTLEGGRCEVSERATGRPHLEVLTSPEVWSEIASGAVSPLEAFERGDVRLRGDIELARVVFRRARET